MTFEIACFTPNHSPDCYPRVLILTEADSNNETTGTIEHKNKGHVSFYYNFTIIYGPLTSPQILEQF